MKKIKVCAYCRVSTSKKDQQNSFENQQNYFKEYFKDNAEYELEKVYADKGISGTSLKNRNEFIQMLIDCGLEVKNIENDSRTKIKMTVMQSNREPQYKYIYVSNSSRFGRNVVHVIDIIRELRSKKVYVVFMDRNMSTEDERDMQFLPSFFLFDEMESEDKSKKVREGYKKSATLTDKIHSNSRIYGFTYDKANNKLLVNEAEAEVIKKIFNLYSENVGVRRIIHYLESNNYKTRDGKVFSKSTINSILRNEKYCGINARLKYDTGEVFNKHYGKLKDKKDVYINEESKKIDNIISRELFDKCTEIRSGKISSISQLGINRGKSEWAELIKCGKCGANYIRNSDKGRIFYNCGKKKSQGLVACNNVNINLDEINKFIEEYRLHKYKKYVEYVKKISVRKLESIKQDIIKSFDEDVEKEVQILRNEITELNEQRSRVIDLYAKKRIDEEILDEKVEKIQVNIKFLSEKISNLSKGNEEKLKDIKIIDDNITYISGMVAKEEYTREEVIKFIEYIKVSSVDSRKYSREYLNKYYPNQIKRNGKIVGVVEIKTKFDEKFRDISMKYKHIPPLPLAE